MYRTLICIRYLLSRWLSLAGALGVFLGVGTLIVVLAVMTGFVHEIRDAIRGGLSDVIIEADVSGFPYYDELARRVREHSNVAEATPLVQLYGLARITPAPETGYSGTLSRPCIAWGIRPAEYARVSKFAEYVQGPESLLEEPALDVPADLAERMRAEGRKVYPACLPGRELVSYTHRAGRPTATVEEAGEVLNPPGSRLVVITFPIKPTGTFATTLGTLESNMKGFTVVGTYKSKLYEYDSKYIFLPFEAAQELGSLQALPTDARRPDGDPWMYPPRAHQIHVDLVDYGKADETMAELQETWDQLRLEKTREFIAENRPSEAWPRLPEVTLLTWEQRQATILGVYEMQRLIMIILLGLVVVVAGFMIGAILSMIVREKTRDVGILKSLGASNGGVAQIFLRYAAVISGIGSLTGMAAGLVFVANIDAIESWLSGVLGVVVFDRTAYYFDHIPTYVDAWHVAAVVVGAVGVAVGCSLLAAWRAARLQPVEALRYE